MVGIVFKKRCDLIFLYMEKLIVPQYSEDYILIGNRRQVCRNDRLISDDNSIITGLILGNAIYLVLGRLG